MSEHVINRGELPETVAAKRDGFLTLIWSWLLEDGPSTAGELAQKHQVCINPKFPGMGTKARPVNTIAPRLTELLQLGEIEWTGETRRTGRRGPKARVFRVVNKSERTGDDATRRPAASLFDEYGLK